MFTLLLICPLLVNGQSKIQQRDLIGYWRLGLDMENAIRSEGQTTELPARALVNGLAALIGTFTETIDVQFRFLPDGKVQVITKEKNQDKIEESTYKVTDGRLILDGSKSESDQYARTWVSQGKRLHPLNDDGSVNRWVWLERK